MARRERRPAVGSRPSTTAHGVPSGIEGGRRAAAAANTRARAVEGTLREAARLRARPANRSTQSVHRTLIHAVCDLIEQQMDSDG